MKRFFLMLLASCALSVFAETAIVNDITWSYQVSGEGTATLGVGTSPVTGALVIPTEIAGYVVTAIGDEAFYNCTGLTSVTIPSSVTAIGFSAFGACSQLTEVIFEGEPPTEAKDSSFPEVAGYYSVQHADAWAAVIQEGTWKRLTMGQKMVNVVFDANGGEGGETFTSAYGASVTEPTVMREGYTFLGWDKEVATIVSLEDVTYTAQWREGYVWDAEKSGFYDSAGKEAVIEGEFTLMVDFTMPNVNKMAENLFMFKAMKGEREIGEVGFCHLSSNTKLRYSIGELVQDPNAYYSAGHYSNVRLYNGGVGSNLATISLFNPAEGLPTVANIVVDFANGETTGVETRKRGTFFSEYGFSLTSLDLGEGVEVNSAYLMPAPRHLQVPNKECFSVNFATGSQWDFYTGTGATGLYAVKGWNNLLGQNGARTALDMWDGTSLTSTNVGITYSASNSYEWTTASDAFLKAYLDEYSQSVEITLEDIPFSQYSVIVYTATDDWNARFRPVQINGVYYAGVNTYTDGIGYATKVAETDEGWGASRSHYARFGTNALRVDGLSGDLTIQGGEYIAKCRGCIAAIQVINTGDLSNDIVYVGRQAMGRAYSLMFRGTHSTDWSTVNNWQTLTTTLSEEGTPIETWEDYSGNVPGIKQGNFHDSLLIDGALLSDNITLENNYKLVNAPTLEGWNQVIGVVNGAHLSIERLTKLQAVSDWRVDETSKMTINAYDKGNPNNGTHDILCLAEEGIEFKTDCDISFNYALGKAGSVCYAGLSGTHTIQQLELDLGDSSKVGIELKRRKLIGFTSSSATFNAKNSIVTTTEEGVPAVETALPLRVGEYTFEVQEDGYYVNYMAYGDNIRQVLQATISRNMSLSEIKFVGGESVVVELTLADGVTLTIDEAPLLAAIRLISPGDISIVGSVEALENVGGVVAIDVQGDATYEAVGYYYEIPFAKLVGFDKIKKTGSVEWRPNDLSALKDYQLEVANGKMLVNTAMQTVGATAEKPVLVTGEGAVLRFEGNQELNRMPNDGYVRAEKGAQIELKGVNPFNHDNAPRVVLDEGILKVEATNGCHLKLHSVTMSNGSEIQLSRMATAHVSEGLVLCAQDSATILATAGNNTIKYLDDGTATNVLKLGGELGNGIVDVAQGATLDVQVAVTTSASALTKSGEGTLVWNGTTTYPFVIEAGEIVFNADAQPTNAFSGAGTIVADGATLDLTKATITGCALAVRKNGVLILNQDQVGQMTVPAGSTLKVKVADYEALTLEGVTLAEGENVTFILPNGTEVEGEGNTLPEQPVYTYTAVANEANLWSEASKWLFHGESIDAAPTGKILSAVKINSVDGNATLTMDVANVQLSDLIVENNDLTLAGEETLTVAMLTTTHKVIVDGTLVLEGGSEGAPVNVANALAVNGTLTTKGYIELVGANNVSENGTLEVASGVTLLNLIGQGMAGKLVIAKDATCKNGTADGLKYENEASPEVDVAGTLELTGNARWSFTPSSTTILREGAILKGVGGGKYGYAYDWFEGGIIKVLGNATIAGKIGSHNGGQITIDITPEKKLTITGKLDGAVQNGYPASRLKVTGQGSLSFVGVPSTHGGGTTIDEGTTVEVLNLDYLGLTGLVEVNGRLRVLNSEQINHSSATSHMIDDTTPRLIGTGVLEFAGTQAYYAMRDGFKTPLTFENNKTAGVVISNTRGMTIGSLAGNGRFRSDFGDATNGADARVLTILQTKETTFTGIFDANSTTNSRRIHVVVDRAEGVEEGVDTTLTLGGTNSNGGVSMTVAEAGSVNVTGIWACPMTVAGTIRGEGQMATLTLCDGATLAGAVNVTGNVTLEGEIKVAHAQRIGDVVMTCANAAEINLAKLSPAPQGLKYVVNGNQIQLEEVGTYFVNGVDYATLNDAINAANELTEGDKTIVLYRATTLEARVQIDSTVTIDLAGQTLTENVGDDSNAGAFDVTATGLLTIKDTVGGGKIASDGGIVITNVGEVMIESGIILAGDDTAHDVAIYNLYHDASTYGKLEMANGEITSIWNCGEAEITAGEVTVINNRGALGITEGVSVDTILLQRAETIEVSNAGIVTAPAGLNVITDEEGYQVLYGEGQYTLDQIVVTASFGLNFSHENGEGSKDAIVPANGVGVGFFTEKYAAPTCWRNGKSSAADQGDFILENGTLYRVYWSAFGKYSSECGLDTDTKKLLHTYLDDRSHEGEPGRVKASVTITNLPEDKKYAVALILAGDADNTTAMYNHKYSPVLINGQVYSYDAQANLLTGEAAQSATQWGNRSKAISEEGKLTIGTNVMFVEGLSGGVLSITSAMDEIDVSRLTIAGVQVWITNENVTPAASPISENAEAISVNFNTELAGYAVAAEQFAGLYPVDGWNNVTGGAGSLAYLNVSDGESETTLPISLKFSSQNVYAWDSATEAYLKGYLDDCDRAPQVEVSNIPFETYSVIVYSATDTARRRFWPIQVNGTHYVGSSTYNPGVGYAASVESSKVGLLPWGGSRNLTAVYGTNAIRVDGLTGETLTIKTASGTSKSARGGIAAIQIVNTGAPVMTEVQEIDWTEFGATSLAVSDLADLITKPIVKLKVAAGATLVVEQPLPVYTIKVVSTGDVAIKVTNLEEISGTMLQQMFDTEYVEGSVTYDYEETFGYTKDDVMYPLIFRGTTDANWETVANWYTGTRKNATEMYWMPYTATLAPNLRLSLDWNAMLFDGDLIGDNIDVQSDGYKTITVTTPVEGWTSRIGVMNGVHLKIESLHKLQGGGTWRIDETSKVTVMNKANPGTNDANNRYHVEAEEGLVFVNMPMPGGTAHLGAKGSIKTGSFAAEQSIGEVVLDLGDSSLLGKRTVSRRLYAFTTGTTFNVANCTVKTTVDTITATKVETLQNVGDYWFESKADGYYINYVAYAPKLPESVTGETAEWLQEVLAQAGVTSSEVTLADGVTAEMLEEARLLGVIPEVNGAEVAVATSFTVSDIVVDETTITLAVMIAVEQGELPETVTLGGEVKLMVAQSLADEWTTVVPMPENIEVIRASDPNIQEAVISVTYDRSDYKFFRVVVTP